MIQLVVSIGIIGVLFALLIPAITRMREQARRATDLSSLRLLTVACIQYATEFDGALPPGRTNDKSKPDDYIWINYAKCWKLLVDRTPDLNSINSCVSVRDGYGEANEFGKSQSEYGDGNDTEVGWVYWGGRDDLTVNGNLQYRSLSRIGQRLTPGSQTLWTCWCWDSNGSALPSVCPHVGSKYVEYARGVALKPPPDGLAVGLVDGSASFVSWSELVIIPQANGVKLYYQP